MKNSSPIRTLGLAVASATLSANICPAATLAWNVATFSNTNQISSVGTTEYAMNLGTTTAVSMNGINFVGTSTAFGGTASATAGYYTGAGITGLTGTESNTLLDTINFGSGGGTQRINFAGLTIGLDYTIQIMLSRSDVAGQAGQAYSLGHSVAPGGAGVFTDGPNTHTVEGFIASTTFTATEASQDVFVIGNAGSNNWNMAAAQLRAVPEPSSTALLGLGGLALILRRRK